MRVAIIDDEMNCIGILSSMLSELLPEMDLVGTAQSVSQGITLLQAQKPDLLFLDIQLRGGSGFDILQQIQLDHTALIFTTAYSEYAIKAFDFSAVHYLLKPIEEESLIKAIELYKKRQNALFNDTSAQTIINNVVQNTPVEHLRIAGRDDVELIKVKDLVRCEADSNYTIFFMTNGHRIVSAKSLHIYADVLQKQNFVRIHDKHLVNLAYVTKYIRGVGGQVLLSNGDLVDVSKRRKKDFIDAFERFA